MAPCPGLGLGQADASKLGGDEDRVGHHPSGGDRINASEVLLEDPEVVPGGVRDCGLPATLPAERPGRRGAPARRPTPAGRFPFDRLVRLYDLDQMELLSDRSAADLRQAARVAAWLVHTLEGRKRSAGTDRP
ncbi:hypothetical protein Vlu01_35370 [Micromonospora lutea]|uniref:Uncharacterized protein n=1 Tax=Micromonospora lutea TaxID=419825 RepID=A0ABQ4IYB0_9ACTN|nr:hypothetical protein Vlu01_35370 [Micromonospora lutea]